MRYGRVFLGLFCIAAATVIADSVYNFGLIGHRVDHTQFLPPGAIFQYQPPPAGLGVFGDFVWGVAQVLSWMARTPLILAEMMALFGVPPIIASIISALVTISFAAYIIYLVAGRVLF